MVQKKKDKSGGCKTAGRSKRKQANRSKPISRYVRGKITAEKYFKLTGQKAR